MWRTLWKALLCLLLAHGVAAAAVPVDELIAVGVPPNLAPYLSSVTVNEGSWSSTNQYGCVGAFQFCPGTFEQYYSGSQQDFLNDPKAQVDAYMKYAQDEWAKAQRNGLTSAIGHEVCYNGVCTTITESSILMACQFGCGTGGKLDNFIRNGYSCDGPNKTTDGNGTSICKYLVSGAGHNVEDITGNASPETGAPSIPGGGGGSGIGQSETTGNFASIGAWTATINRFNENIASKLINLVQQGSEFFKIGMMFMVAIGVLYLAGVITLYVFQRATAPQTLGRMIYAGFVMAIFVTYAVVVTVVSWTPYSITALLQSATLGSDDAFAPMAYLYKVTTNIQFRDQAGGWSALGGDDSQASAGFAVAFLFVQTAYLLAIAWATIWPIVYFFALKLIGLAALPFLLAGRLEFVFAGWLRQIMALAIFVLLVNAVMIANVLLIAFAFNIQFNAPTSGQTIVSGLLARALIIAIILFGTVAIFQVQRIAAAWAGAGAALSTGFSRTLTTIVSRGISS
jgi:hypothetical protein